jgi:hypothetical protein
MLKFKIEDIEYKVPEFINIENYVKIYKVKDLFKDEYFAAKVVSIVCDAPLQDLLDTDYEEVYLLAAEIMGSLPLEKPEFKDRFELDGVQYGFFPNWRDLTFAEFVDLDTISTKKPEELLDLMHILAAIMYRPILEERSEHDYTIEKYNVDTMKIRAELFKKKLDIKYVLGAQFFFIKFVSRYLSYSHLSSMQNLSIWMKIKMVWNLRKWIWAAIRRSKKSTDGTLSSTKLLETILQNTNMSTTKQ